MAWGLLKTKPIYKPLVFSRNRFIHTGKIWLYRTESFMLCWITRFTRFIFTRNALWKIPCIWKNPLASCTLNKLHPISQWWEDLICPYIYRVTLCALNAVHFWPDYASFTTGVAKLSSQSLVIAICRPPESVGPYNLWINPVEFWLCGPGTPCSFLAREFLAVAVHLLLLKLDLEVAACPKKLIPTHLLC